MKKVCLLISSMLLAGSLSAAITKGPYLIYANSATSMTVLWQTDVTQSCTLQWGTNTSYTAGSVSSTEISSSTHQHKKTITGLAAGTLYYYKVTISTSTYTGSFRAAPASTATDLKFIVYGDTRSYPTNHNLVASRIVSTLTADSAYQTFALHVADFVNEGETESSWTSEFFPRNYSSILSMHSKIPIVGTMGNHEDDGVLYKKYFPYPFVADRYWSFDYGPMHVSVVDQCVISTLDTSFVLSSTQYNWLTNDLAQSAKKWKVVLLHHPGFSAGGSHENNVYVTNTLHPRFLQYGVTAVFGGHNHYYARAVKDGIHYVTTGGGGAPQNTPSASYPYIVTVNKTYEFCKVAISGDNFNCKSVKASDGSIIDDFTVTKSSSGGTTVSFTSVAAHDGYVDELSETSNVGGSMSATLTTGTALRVGDTGARKQRKTIVSFDTSSLPDTAVVTAATLKLKRGGILGDPSVLGSITVDIKNTSFGFGTTEALEIIDFEAAASKSNVGTLSYPTANETWATASLNADGTSRINLTDHTQFRVRFVTDDDNDTADDYLGFYSGDNATAANRPVLEVTYQ